jgi:anti-anti-sigma factor
MSDLSFEEVNRWLIIRFSSSNLTQPMQLERIREEIEQKIASLPDKCRVCMSFKRVEFVSSQIIGTMLAAKDQVKRKKGTFALARLGKNVQEILRLTRLDKQFDIKETETDVVGKRPDSGSASGKSSKRPEDVDWVD